MKLTMKELERVMVTARLIEEHCGIPKNESASAGVVINFDEHPIFEDTVMFHCNNEQVWSIKADQFRRGISPLDIFNEEKKGRYHDAK